MANTQTTTLSQANCRKVFVQRDFSQVSCAPDPYRRRVGQSPHPPSSPLQGSGVQFATRFPAELEGKIDRSLFDYTVSTLNSLYAEAEKGSCSTYCEGCMACLTAYIIYFCAETHYEKCLKKVSRFVHEQNEQVWTKHGLLITDPVERGLRLAP